MKYVVIDGNTFIPVRRQTVVVVGPDDADFAEMVDAPADNTRLAIIDLLDLLNLEDGE